jgi:DNA repair exonuclease SbcCD ATPase subunit
VAKGKCGVLDVEIEKDRKEIELVEAEIERLSASIERLKQSSANFSESRDERRKTILLEAVKVKKKRDEMELPDLDKLKKKWEVVETIKKKLDALRREGHEIQQQMANKTGTGHSLESRIKQWEDLAGTICLECEQPIGDEHTKSKVEPLKDDILGINLELGKLEASYARLEQTIVNTQHIVSQKMPPMAVDEAEGLHRRHDRMADEIERLKLQADLVASEDDPHEDSMQEAKQNLEEAEARLKKLREGIEQKVFRSRHYYYIQKAYGDRGKIKSFVFREHIPFINSRIRHYLEVFDLDVAIELTSSLGVSSNLWGYEFESGGERKRTDVAFMLAMFDFHEQMYGRQCNLLVLDEVDGRLDDDGIDALINIIKNDLSARAESVLVISHRNMMFDTFPNEIKVERTERFSHLRRVA